MLESGGRHKVSLVMENVDSEVEVREGRRRTGGQQGGVSSKRSTWNTEDRQR